MNDITIKGKRITREFIILLVCVLLAFGINIYSILTYQTSWVELWTYLPMVILLGIMIYFILAALRFLVYVIRKVFFRKPQGK